MNSWLWTSSLKWNDPWHLTYTLYTAFIFSWNDTPNMVKVALVVGNHKMHYPSNCTTLWKLKVHYLFKLLVKGSAFWIIWILQNALPLASHWSALPNAIIENALPTQNLMTIFVWFFIAYHLCTTILYCFSLHISECRII